MRRLDRYNFMRLYPVRFYETRHHQELLHPDGVPKGKCPIVVRTSQDKSGSTEFFDKVRRNLQS